MAGNFVTLLLGTLALGASPDAGATPGLACGEAVCWESTLSGADGATLPITPAPNVLLGEVVKLTLDVAAPEDAGIFVPSNPALDSWRLVRSTKPAVAAPTGSSKTTRTVLELRALRVGAKAIPPIEVTWRLADGTTGNFSTERRLVSVRGRLDNEQDPALGVAPPPVAVIATSWWRVGLAALLGGGLLALLLAPLVRRLRRGARPAPPPPPPRPAIEVALEALAWLESAEISAAERYAGAVDTLRAYLGGRYDFDGLESTTAEFLEELRPLDIDGVATTEIETILHDADLVKFAKLIPSDEEALRLVQRVREIVIATWVAPDEEEQGQESLPEVSQEEASS